MYTVDIHDARTHLSLLLERAARGETVVIARAGRPIAKLVPFEAATPENAHRLGFLQDAFELPEDFDTLGGGDLAERFEDPTRP